jgi:NAD(P)-dependent dehydrogenase (short-subunit alcohol dehydrogenase family)
MSKEHFKIVLVTGASSGIGKTCATHLHDRGYRVVGTSRQEQPETGAYAMIQMDVDDDLSVQQGIALLLQREGRIDAVVNNAGYGLAGALEDTSMQEAKAQLETNFFGTLRVCRAVLPAMRAQRAGHIVNISSMAGQIALPFQALYSASKSAVEGMSEALSMEVRRFGIHVVLVEPGDFSTGFTAARRRTRDSEINPVYQEQLERALGTMEQDEMHGGPPVAVARRVERILQSASPRLRYGVGPAFEKLAVQLKKVLPSRLFEWIIMKYYKLA